MDSFMNYDFNIDKIILACFVPAGTGDAYHKDRPSHGIALHTGGVKEYVFDSGKTLTVNKGDIIYLPKYSTYKVTSSVNGDCYAVNFTISEDITFSPFVMKSKNTEEFKELFKSAVRAWKEKKSGFTLKCKSDLYGILYQLKQEYNIGYVSKNKLEMIMPAVDFIHKNYTSELLNVSELSKMCNITPEYFRHIFKMNYGTSPIKYINALKIARAKELIESRLYSVSTVAELSGFSELSHFSREFKKATGKAPTNYNLADFC